MAKKKQKRKRGNESVVTFTVAECGEFHSLGKYYDGIRTLEEAAAIYHKKPPERMHGNPAIGLNLHVKGTEKWEDLQADILSGDEIDIGMVKLVPGFGSHPQVQQAVKAIIEKFPEKKVIDY